MRCSQRDGDQIQKGADAKSNLNVGHRERGGSRRARQGGEDDAHSRPSGKEEEKCGAAVSRDGLHTNEHQRGRLGK